MRKPRAAQIHGSQVVSSALSRAYPRRHVASLPCAALTPSCASGSLGQDYRHGTLLAFGIFITSRRRLHASYRAVHQDRGPIREQFDSTDITSERHLCELRAEIVRLQAVLPPFVLDIQDPVVAPFAVDEEGDLGIPNASSGPWYVHVTVTGDPDSPAYADPLKFRLEFNTGWPQEPPEVRIGGFLTVNGFFSERLILQLFYQQLAQCSRDRYHIVNVVRLVRQVLLNPLVALGFSEDDAKEEGSFAQRLQTSHGLARQLDAQRVAVIKEYESMAIHPVLFKHLEPLHFEWFAPEFWQASCNNTAESWQGVLTEHLPGSVFSFQLFTEEFCDMLLEEVFNFYASGLPANAPNSMNRYGIILADIGLEAFIDKLQALLQPLGQILFPVVGSGWDGHHCFIVRYREGEDLGLDMHNDDSEVTFNICLGLDFAGAGLQFCGHVGAPDHRQRSLTYLHGKGRCVVHVGRHRHGADDISSGERLNLILWNHSSTYRQTHLFKSLAYHREASPPDLVCLSFTHDRDFGSFLPYPTRREDNRGKGWCPPPLAEYEGFEADSAPQSISND